MNIKVQLAGCLEDITMVVMTLSQKFRLDTVKVKGVILHLNIGFAIAAVHYSFIQDSRLTPCVRAHLALSLHLQTGFNQASLKLLPDEVDLMISRLCCITPSQFHKHLSDAGCVSTGNAAPSLICIGSHRGGEVAIGNDGQPVM